MAPKADDNNRTVYDKVIVDIKDYVFHYEVTDPDAFHHARVVLLDSFGCAIETVNTSPECKNMLGPFVPGSTTPDGFRLPGTNYQLDPVKGAFDFGSMIRYLDHNDALGGADWGHPSDNLGALLAVSDWLDRSSTNGSLAHQGPPLTMRTLLIATIKAYEIQGCFQLHNAFNAVGLDHTLLVKVASTAVVSWLLGLTEEQTLSALSQAWMDGHALRTFRAAPNTNPRKGWAAGDACMRAVILPLLTKSGQPGGPTPLTAPRWGFYECLFQGKQFSFPRPYGSWVISHTVFKLVPAEGHGLSAVESASKLCPILKESGIDPARDIAKIKVRTHHAAVLIINKTGALYNAADRDHCMQYMIAVVLLKGALVEAVDYSNSSPYATDPRIADLRAKIELTEDPQLTADYHDLDKRSAASGLTVVLNDGTELDEVLVEYPVGHPGNAGTLAGVQAKFKRSMKLAFKDDEVEKIVAALEDEKMPISRFVDLWVRKNERMRKL